eukprot:CAMPEP_0119573566 /NCGR_PEP_ID=MMETSP1352-20130426/45188_1 /TAXON_ID=265584 /ORGANISM="Stauroneis constricta, Strain CCMP1120" /LENGTH=604 /DNA_ID=CAMNT_0007623257 /DNA_START=67 /DNA_END=1881 /DNA_ORIENTATION=-
MGKKKRDVEYFAAILKDCQELCYSKAPAIKSSHRKSFVEACEIYHSAYTERNAAAEALEVANANDDQDAAGAAQTTLEEQSKNLEKSMRKAIKSANKIFEHLDLAKSEALEESILKGSIVLQATPEGLAKFCAEEKVNGKLIDALLGTPDLMKEMISAGGAKGGNYGMSMKIYTQIMASMPEVEDDFTEVNKKLAMAVALELAMPIYEFDTKIEVLPKARYQHYDTAHRNGELDPAFPNFTVWEMRHIVNSEAANEQLQWGRDCIFAYAPYITTVVDPKWRYLYILKSDVLTRQPSWTSSPRTFQQVLSGGGKDAPNAWFGRFVCKTFGIPTWGAKQPGRVGLTRWTPTGWEAMLGIDWDLCTWEGESGIDFKGEVDARGATTTEEYYVMLVLLECLADILDSRRGSTPDEEKGVLNPHRVWRSLSIIKKALMLQPASPGAFERNKKSIVKTKVETYLADFERDDPPGPIRSDSKGVITIPATSCGFSSDLVMSIASSDGGKQLNFLSDGYAEYELPDELPSSVTYRLKIELCTVHLKQSPLGISVDEGTDTSPQLLKIPYTIGEWKTVELGEIVANGGSIIKLSRPKPSYGLAMKKLILEPIH